MTHSPATRSAAPMPPPPWPVCCHLHKAAAVAALPAADRDGAGAGLCNRVPDRPGPALRRRVGPAPAGTPPAPTGATGRRARTGATG